MKLKNIEQNTMYYVTKTKGTEFFPGDRLKMFNGVLLCYEACGFLEKGQWEHLDVEVEIFRAKIN